MKFLRLKPQNNDCDIERIEKLQLRMKNRIPTICAERAEIVTDIFKENIDDPIIIRRAKAFAATLERMTIYIEEDSLIIGNQASRNFAAPIFPEYSFDWVIDELDEFEKRSGDYFKIDEETKERLRPLQDFWKGKTHMEEVLANLAPVNRQAEDQGVLHRGGISMSGDGHIIPNHPFVLETGYGGMADIAREKLENKENLTDEQIEYYQATIIAMEGALKYIKRFSKLAATEAEKETDPKRKSELETLAEMFDHLMIGKARNFYEAVQTVYLTHLLMMIESNGHSFSFGRFDQDLNDYYIEDIEKGILTKEKALEIITHFFLMNNTINKVRPWGHTQYSGGYPLYSNLMLGGTKPDGTDGTNDLSYLCLEAMNMTMMPEPNLSVRFSKETPEELLEDAAKLIRTGYGMPSLFCDEVVIPAMMTLDLDIETARNYASMGCVETAVPGKWGHRATGMTYINFGKVFELVLNNGYDKETGIQLIKLNGKDGPEIEFETYEDLWKAWEKALKFYFDLAVDCDYVCDRALKKHDADPFASSTIDCSLERGLTLKNGGAEYDYISQSNIGPSVVGDSLAAIKKLIFDDKVLTLEQLKEVLEANFEGEDGDRIRSLCKKAPKFGNDIDYVDEIVADVYDSYLKLLPDYKTDRYGKGPKGCGYTMSTSNITSYVPNGFAVGATPDGRLAGKPLNEGASPCLSADTEGPTAVINSVSKLPNDKIAGGQLLNMRFTPSALAGEDNLNKFVSFIKMMPYKNIFHNQFNIVDSKTLREAKADPEKHKGLVVRVAGYCALFSTLMPEAQDAIIARTEHSL